MTRINPLPQEARVGKAGELLGVLEKKMGRIPNMMATLANSPAALEAYMNMSGALAGGKLSAQEREAIAIQIGSVNRCGYCVAAHSKIGSMAGLTGAEIENAKTGTSTNARTRAILAFAGEIAHKQGWVSDTGIATARSNGLSDQELIEIVGVVSLNIYTNYLNHLMDPVVDF